MTERNEGRNGGETRGRQTERERERTPLEHRYGEIGISAVAAAATLDRPRRTSLATRIPSRFEEDSD